MTNSALDLLKNKHVQGTIAHNTEWDILLQHNDPASSRIRSMATCIRGSQIIFSLLWRQHESSTRKPILPLLHDLDHLRPSPTKSSRKCTTGDLSGVNETTSGSSTCVLVGCPNRLTFILAERAKTSQSFRVTATGPSHADSEDHRARIQPPALEIDLLSSVAIQPAEYGLGRLCCSYNISHTFTSIVVGTNLP